MRYTSKTGKLQATQPPDDSFIDTENRLRVGRYRRLGSNVPRQRIGAITKILKHRHGDACTTDDAGLWFDVVVPFLIARAGIEGYEPLPAVLAWCRLFLPAYAAELGAPEIERHVETTQRDQEAAKRGRVRYLPTLPDLADRLRLRFEEVTAIGLRGWPSINPPTTDTKRSRNRDRMRGVRQAKGVRPQSSRTMMKDADDLAACIGVTRRTILRWRKANTVSEMVRQRIEAGSVDVTKACALSLLGKYMAQTSVTSAPAANDDASLAISA